MQRVMIRDYRDQGLYTRHDVVLLPLAELNWLQQHDDVTFWAGIKVK